MQRARGRNDSLTGPVSAFPARTREGATHEQRQETRFFQCAGRRAEHRTGQARFLQRRVQGDLEQTYTVEKGDNLSTIAKHFYGRQDWKRIYDANRDQLDDPDRIKPGQVLKIPPQDDPQD